MKIEYGADKDEVNRFKHRLPLAFGTKIFDDPLHAVLASLRPVDGEDRYKAVGMLDGKLHTAVYVWRSNTIRLISVRRSNTNERREYDRDTG